MGDVLLTCEQVKLRAACRGHYMRRELRNVLPVAVGPDSTNINHFVNALGTGSVPFGFCERQLTFTIKPFIRAWAVSIKTFMPCVTLHITNSGERACQDAQLSEIIKMSYIMNACPPDLVFCLEEECVSSERQ